MRFELLSLGSLAELLACPVRRERLERALTPRQSLMVSRPSGSLAAGALRHARSQANLPLLAPHAFRLPGVRSLASPKEPARDIDVYALCFRASFEPEELALARAHPNAALSASAQEALLLFYAQYRGHGTGPLTSSWEDPRSNTDFLWWRKDQAWSARQAQREEGELLSATLEAFERLRFGPLIERQALTRALPPIAPARALERAL